MCETRQPIRRHISNRPANWRFGLGEKCYELAESSSFYILDHSVNDAIPQYLLRLMFQVKKTHCLIKLIK